ncbi:hypothetical protein G5B88_08355 [Herbaspirillum seropedicae]|uniref:Transmembrane protein n=1 Tax=Herbaspirillum seropedicae (strain SmR1) TaxID=757424 RepID=D8IQS0_HERSS|nr:hypothetical protein [Herbaspirillum seropedicae]ADJ63181.1 transmembrane protein [Herbaspirillum seropedicae SmR1]AKN65231.1 hypothetical protein ACP92_08290 [Herbaspirillum seropedicae]NQE31461.1 hypothetical protein [Herbaspirillum seropedicae]UMU21187.1 hypothetical protein G5B88_08355 [Herbaspirillum seropedicae]
MKFLVATRSRRVALSFFAAAIAMFLNLFWMYHLDQIHPRFWSTEELMSRLLGMPALLMIAVLSLTTACSWSPLQGASGKSMTGQPDEPARPFKAQVVGVQWLNPLMRRDYTTEWQLLWVLGLAKPNKNDDELKRDPKVFSTVQPISPIKINWKRTVMYPDGTSAFPYYLERYMEKILQPIGRRYAMHGGYFYTIQPRDRKRWRELHGIHIEFAIPETPVLPPELAAEIIRKTMNAEFEFYDAELSTGNIPADVSITTGGASAGFTSLSAALDYLQANPEKSVWVMNWDSPQFPDYGLMTENCTLLVLAGPHFDTQREPLAWIARPAVRQLADGEVPEGMSRRGHAWNAAIRSAADQAEVKPADIGYVIHDAGHGNDTSGKRIGTLGEALTLTMPELDFVQQTFNTPKLLGDMRAGTAVTNLALAIAWSHQKGKPVLVAGTTEEDKATAVVVTPPSRARVFNPDKDWFRARGEGNAYLPWWGLRRKVDWATVWQGFSD